MKKSFHPQCYILILTVAAAIIGAVIRFRQLQFELLPDGSLAEGSYLHIPLIILSVVLIGGLIGLLLPLSERKSWEQVFSSHPLPNALLILFAAGLALGNVLFWLNGSQTPILQMTQSPKLSAALLKLLPPLGILSAGCIAAFAVMCVLKKKPSPALYMVFSVYLIVRLIVRFQAWNTDPSIHDYCFKLLASICCMLGAFQLAGFSFGKGHRRITVFWTLCAVVFCCISLPDAYLNGTADDLLITASVLLLMAVSGAQLLLCKEALPEEAAGKAESEPSEEKMPED